MPIAAAIRSNAASLADSHQTYKEHVVTVNNYVTSVLASSLPVLSSKPPNWDEFVAAYEKANSDALDWVNNVMARLLSVPDEVRGYNTMITQLLGDARTQASTLVQHPDNTAAKAALQQDLSGLSSQLGLVISFISGAITSVQSFKDQMPEMARQLQTIAEESAKAADADEDKIKKLQDDIDSLRSEIEQLTAAIIGLGIADGVALTIGTVATIALWPVGAVTWFVLGPAVAVASTYIALDALQIKADKEKIEADQQAMDTLTADVSTLRILADNYADMAAQADKIEDNLQAILAAWQSLESDVNRAIADVNAATTDAGSEEWQKVLDEVADATDAWNEAYEAAGDLHLDLEANTAELGLGMSSDEVEQALAQGTTMDIITYYNQAA